MFFKKDPLKEPKEPNGKNGIIVFLSIIFVLFAIPVVMAQNDLSTKPYVSNSSLSSNSVESNDLETELTGSNSENISEIETNSETAAIAWAMDNMQQYGKISDERFSSGIVDGKFIADFKFRSPNVYNAKEQHELIMQYQKGPSGWKLNAVDFDGQIVSDDSKAAG